MVFISPWSSKKSLKRVQSKKQAGPAQVGAISKAQKQQKDFKMSTYW